ncbi:MAG: bifunctional nuclease family protein [Candidatus Zixiibacteriota bacterium]
MKMVEVKIDGLALDMTTNTPVVILSPAGLDKVLPIWIGHAEAWAIAMELSGIGSNRPLTHDLLKQVIAAFNARIDRIEITELREQTFYAVIHLVDDHQSWQIDARPSDSIALALKTGSKIYVNEELFNITPDTTTDDKLNMPTDPESLRDRLKKINPEDFGKYSL